MVGIQRLAIAQQLDAQGKHLESLALSALQPKVRVSMHGGDVLSAVKRPILRHIIEQRQIGPACPEDAVTRRNGSPQTAHLRRTDPTGSIPRHRVGREPLDSGQSQPRLCGSAPTDDRRRSGPRLPSPGRLEAFTGGM